MADAIVQFDSQINRSLVVAIPADHIQALVQAILDLSAEGEIRTTEDGRFSVFDVIENVTGRGNPRDAWKRLQSEHSEVVGNCDNFQFPGPGQRPTPATDLAGCLEIIWVLPGETAKKMRRIGAQINAAVIQQAAHAAAPTQIQALLIAVQQMAEMEQRQIESDRRLAEAEAQLNELHSIRSAAYKELTALPPATHQVPPETTDMKIRRIVNSYAAATGIQQSEVFRSLYTQHFYRYRRRVSTEGRESKLQAFVRLGLIDSLYDLAIELFGSAA